MNHTPGPWTTSREDMDSYTTGEDGEMTHVVYVYRGKQPRIPIYAGDLDNARAEAALISAAPDLLEACKFIRDCDAVRCHHCQTAVRNAIAKAERREQK